MMPFGPQLIGQTEKALSALLGTLLSDDRLTEPHWVTLRLAAQLDGVGSLLDHVRDAAHLSAPEPVLSDLEDRGLVAGDRLTDAGRDLVERIGRRIATATATIWAALDPGDVAPTERALNTVLDRTRETLASLPE